VPRVQRPYRGLYLEPKPAPFWFVPNRAGFFFQLSENGRFAPAPPGAPAFSPPTGQSKQPEAIGVPRSGALSRLPLLFDDFAVPPALILLVPLGAPCSSLVVQTLFSPLFFSRHFLLFKCFPLPPAGWEPCLVVRPPLSSPCRCGPPGSPTRTALLIEASAFAGLPRPMPPRKRSAPQSRSELPSG